MRDVPNRTSFRSRREGPPNWWQRIDWRFVGLFNIVVLAGNLVAAIPAEMRETRGVTSESAPSLATIDYAEPGGGPPVLAQEDEAPSWDGERLALIRAADKWRPVTLSTLANTRLGGRTLTVVEVRPDIPLISLLEDDPPLAQQRLVACDLTPDKAPSPNASAPATQPVPKGSTNGHTQVAYVFGNVKCTFDAWPANRRSADPVLESIMKLAARTGSGPVLRDLDVQ